LIREEEEKIEERSPVSLSLISQVNGGASEAAALAQHAVSQRHRRAEVVDHL